MKRIDETERPRRFFNTQYVKMKRMAAVGSLVLLAVNLAFTIYPYIDFRMPNTIFGAPKAWLGVPMLFILIIIVIWAAAHIYVKKLEMYRTESRADILYSPYSVYAMAPKEEMMIRNIYLPIMETQLEKLNEGKAKEKMAKEITRIRDWCEKGFIPKDDFPVHLKSMYITEKQRRL